MVSDVFVISDDERRIKKEKKETFRKIKTERVSSKKDSAKRTSPEPSISKKKRKSKEEVDVKSKKKKKKSEHKPMSAIPSSSREVAKVPVGKKKKDEKKKEASKKKEDDVVVLDDSDKEEKLEQKSLLDLLELEMRARAIRSLLKKEERSHSQKVLSEYKDEPDDLIPIEIEPPQIELLSDSDEDVEIDSKLKENKCTEISNDRIASKVAENVCDLEDQENPSRSPLVSPNNDSSSSNALGTQTVTSTNKKQDTFENDSKTITEIKGDNDMQSFMHESCKKTSVQDDDCTNVVSFQENNSCQCSASDNLKPTSKQSDESGIVAKKTSSSKDSELEITTGHFLLYEEPSVVLAIDGSQIEENGVNNRIQHSFVCQRFIKDKTGSKDESDSLAELDQRSSVPVMGSSQINPMGEISNDNDSVEIAAAKSLVLLPEGDENCVTVLSGHSSNSLAPPLQDVYVGESTERNEEYDLHLQFEDEALDYDYNPASSYSEKKSEDVSYQPPSKASCSADEEMLSTGMTLVVNSEQMLSKLGEKRNSSHVEKHCVVSKSNSNKNPSSPEGCLESQDISFDVGSVSSDPLMKIVADNPLIDDTVTNCVLEDASNNEYENQPIVICPEDVVVNSYVFSSKVQESTNPALPLAAHDTGLVSNTPTLQHKIVPPNEEASSTEGEDVFCHIHYTSETENLNLVHADYTSDVKSIVGEEKKVHEEEAEYPELLPIQPQAASTTEGDLVSLTSASKPEEGNKSAEYNELMMEKTFHDLVEAESCTCSSMLDDIPCGGSDSIAPVNEQIPVSYIHDEKKNLLESCSILSLKNVSSVVTPAVDCESTKSGNSLTINTSVTLEMPNEDCRTLDEAGTVETSHSTCQILVYPLSSEAEIVNEAREAHVCEAFEADHSPTHSTTNETPRGLINKDVAEIIDITEVEPVDGPDFVYISEERFDSESIDDSDNEVSGKTALILEQMNSILNDDIADGVDSDNSDHSQLSSSGSSEVPAEILSVDSVNSASETDHEAEDEGQGPKSTENVLDLLEIDDDDNEDGIYDCLSRSNKALSSHSNNGTSFGGEIIEDSIEVVDDSSSFSSVCSVESQKDDLKSDDSVMLVHPNDSKYNDFMAVTQTECSKNNNGLVVIEPDGSESDDCAIVFHPTHAVPDDVTALSNPEIPEAETCCLIPSQTVSAADKESVAVTIVIEDDGEEEVKLLTEDVPAEIFELEDDDELKTNWTARWLESDNVKKVVKTSKIWTNVRKQMKMKLKKSDSPVVSDDLKPPEDKGPPPLIGSVEEYHRLVKEGVICSKATQNDDQTCDSNSSARMNQAIKKYDLDGNDSLKNTASQCSESRSESKSIGSKPDRSKVDEGCKKKSGRKKSDKKKKSDKSERRKKPKNSVEVPCPLKRLSNQSIKQMDSPRMNDKSNLDEKVTKGDVSLEEGEIIEPLIVEVADCVCKKKDESSRQILDEKSCIEGEKTVVESVEDREEGETSEKEEGEISSDDDDVDNSKSQNIFCQPEPSYSQKTPTKPRECNRTDSSLSHIPLPNKPPVKSKPHPTKNPERNSAAKRFILRNLKLGKKKSVTSKNKKKREKGGGGKKRVHFKLAPEKSQPDSFPKVKVPFDTPNLNQMSVVMPNSSLQTTPAIQESYLSAYPALTQPPECNLSLIGQAQSTSRVNSTAQYDSYYSWAYSQGLINSASGNYGYGTPENTPDPNIYKQWEEYYRKLMEACKISAAHASAGAVVGSTETEKSGYTWVFDHAATVSQSAPVQAPADSTADPGIQDQAVDTLPEQSAFDQSPVLVNEMSENDRFESWQFRYGLKGLLKEHFIPAPNPGGDKQT